MSLEGDDDMYLSDQPEKTIEEQLREVVDSLPPPGILFPFLCTDLHYIWSPQTLTSMYLMPKD